MKPLVNFLKLSIVAIILISTISNCSKDDDLGDKPPPPVTYEMIKISASYDSSNIGEIYMWLYDETPLHKSNFLKLADSGYYDSVLFHRVIDNFMIQTGDPTATGNGGPGYTIDAEFDSSLLHKYGAVGAARLGNDVNPLKKSSGSQFYIVEKAGGTAWLDLEYTVFGEVLKGMDIVETIASVPVNLKNKPTKDALMTKVEVVKYTEAELLSEFSFSLPE